MAFYQSSRAKMKHGTIFSRSFSRYEREKQRCGAFLGYLLIALSLCIMIKPYLGLLPVRDNAVETKKMEVVCNFSEPRSDFCEITGDIRIHGNSSTIFVASSRTGMLAGNSSLSIRPYPRKHDARLMNKIRKWTAITAHQEIPLCSLHHAVPAIIFSIGGYSGNFFHAFNDVLIPLYLTSQQFNREVKFLVTDNKSLWIDKYRDVLKKLSKYESIDIDREEEIHCFPSVILGLKFHKVMRIDPSKSLHSMKDFRQLLRSSYSLDRTTAIKIRDGEEKRPRLLLISRSKIRCFMNVGEITEMARSLGYEVVIAEANRSTDLSRFAQIVNSCDVLMGVHGAGLSNILFLPENAILIQVVPFGGLESTGRRAFGQPSTDMNIKYLEYTISKEESSLMQQYPLDDAVLSDPSVLHEQGWDAVKSVYLDKQNVNLDVNRFRATLLEALELLHDQ